MSIKISKDIGYFLPFENINCLLVDDYEEIIDDMYHLSSGFIHFMEKEFEKFKKEYPYDLSYFSTLTHFDFKNLLSRKDVNVNEFIRTIFHGDDELGIMLLTPELAKKCRRDDLMDYYQNTPDDYNIQYLNTPIYPSSFYLCVKDPHLVEKGAGTISKENVKKGDVLTSQQIHFLMLYNDMNPEIDNLVWVNPDHSDYKYFHYYVDILCYLFLTSAKLLKEDISYLEFIQHLQPAIVTSWS